MALDFFAGIPVTDYAVALPWYEQFFGGRPSFLPTDTEAVWEVAEHRYIYIVQQPGRAGNALVLSFVDDHPGHRTTHGRNRPVHRPLRACALVRSGLPRSSSGA